jgi:hypothetical protein
MLCSQFMNKIPLLLPDICRFFLRTPTCFSPLPSLMSSHVFIGPWPPSFQNFRGSEAGVTDYIGRKPQRIQNAADDKQSASRTEGMEWNYCVFVCLYRH